MKIRVLFTTFFMLSASSGLQAGSTDRVIQKSVAAVFGCHLFGPAQTLCKLRQRQKAITHGVTPVCNIQQAVDWSLLPQIALSVIADHMGPVEEKGLYDGTSNRCGEWCPFRDCLAMIGVCRKWRNVLSQHTSVLSAYTCLESDNVFSLLKQISNGDDLNYDPAQARIANPVKMLTQALKHAYGSHWDSEPKIEIPDTLRSRFGRCLLRCSQDEGSTFLRRRRIMIDTFAAKYGLQELLCLQDAIPLYLRSLWGCSRLKGHEYFSPVCDYLDQKIADLRKKTPADNSLSQKISTLITRYCRAPLADGRWNEIRDGTLTLAVTLPRVGYELFALALDVTYDSMRRWLWRY